MKKIEAVVRNEKIEELKEALIAADIQGITIYQVVGCGKQHGFRKKIRGNTVFMNTMPKLYVMIVVPDERLEEILDIIIKTSRTGEVGDGKIFVTDVLDCIRIRTGERGNGAV